MVELRCVRGVCVCVCVCVCLCVRACPLYSSPLYKLMHLLTVQVWLLYLIILYVHRPMYIYSIRVCSQNVIVQFYV